MLPCINAKFGFQSNYVYKINAKQGATRAMIKQFQIVLISMILLTGCSEKMTKSGIHNGHLMECPKTPNCVNSQAKDEGHFIQPIRFVGTPKDAQAHLLKILNEQKLAKIVVIKDDYIRAEFVSKVFRFIDDVEFYFPETEKKETTIHIRSASRVGHSDFGANRKRIEQMRTHLESGNGK